MGHAYAKQGFSDSIGSVSGKEDHEQWQDRISDDIIEAVFVHLDARDLCLKCSLVCKSWQQVIERPSFWKLKCMQDKISVPDLKGHQVKLDYKRICIFKPYDRNFIRNWNAEKNLGGWHVRKNRGDKFAIENQNCHYSDPVTSIGIPGLNKCWVTSYGECEKEQRIDLVKHGVQEQVLDTVKPTILISDLTTPRQDCGSRYTIRVHLLDSKGKSLKHYEQTRQEPQWNGGNWMQILHRFEDYPKGVRAIVFSHHGKDTQFWAGHYGPKFTGSVVRVLPKSSVLPWDVNTNGLVPLVAET